MTAYMIAHIMVNDAELWQVYLGAVGETLAPFGGELLVRGENAVVLTGQHGFERMAVLQFPDRDALNGWYNSDAYQELAKTRIQAADVLFIAYDAT